MKFDHTWTLLKEGKKTQTCRREIYYDWYKNKVGDVIWAEPPENSDDKEILLKVTEVFKVPLWVVAASPDHYTREGYSSGEQFKQVWREIYGPSSWNPPDQVVCVLRFKVLK